jgi:hypothetical protein
MANEKNLKPFRDGDDARRNTTGANSKTVTKYLKEFGESRRISFNIKLTNNDGRVNTIKGVLEGQGKNCSINQIIATQLLSKAVKGDLRAIQEILDRTEGKPKQSIGLDDFFANDTITVGYRDE